jgi:hypothetical protein
MFKRNECVEEYCDCEQMKDNMGSAKSKALWSCIKLDGEMAAESEAGLWRDTC